MALTSKLVSYKQGRAPALPEGLQNYSVGELQKIQQAIKSIEEIMTKLETSPVMTTKAGSVTADDVASGCWKVIWDTTNSTVAIYANMAGTLLKASFA